MADLFMLRWGNPLRWLRGVRLLLLAGLILACCGGALAAHLWALKRFHAAERSILEERLDDARSDVQVCLRVWPRSPATCLLAARIERLANDPVRAEEYVRACRKAQGGPSEASQLAILLIRAETGELPEVEAVLWRLVEQDHPETPQILEALSRAFVRARRFGSALRVLDTWIARAPDTPCAWHWRGEVQEHVTLWERAATDYEHALEGMPNRWDIRLRLAIVELHLQQAQQALPHLEQLVDSHADSPRVVAEMARCQILLGNLDQAEHWVARLLEITPDDEQALFFRAQLDYQAHKPAAAEAWVRKALSRNPHNLEAQWLLYRCLLKQGRKQEAGEVLARHKALERDYRRLDALMEKARREDLSSSAALSHDLGALFLRLGREDEGLEALRRALVLDPHYRPTLELLVRHYEAKGDHALATQYRQQMH
jgi:tetratricopeptide (TPR) repeat protein